MELCFVSLLGVKHFSTVGHSVVGKIVINLTSITKDVSGLGYVRHTIKVIYRR